MSRDRKQVNEPSNAIGDLVISESRLGVGITENLSTLTVRARPPFDLTGTLTTTEDSATVAGVGTQFLSELAVGDSLNMNSWEPNKTVVAIGSDTSLTVDSPFSSSATGQTIQSIPSVARFDDGSGTPQVSVTGQGNVGIGTPGPRAQLEVSGIGSGMYYGCPVGVRLHNTQNSDAWQLVLSTEAAEFQPGALIWVTPDGNNQANLTISTFDGDESHNAVDRVRIDSDGFHLLTGFSVGVNYINANYTVDAGDHYLIADAGGAGITVTLPHAGDCGGRTLTIIKSAGVGLVTVVAASGDTINGAADKVISNIYDGIQFVSPYPGAAIWIATLRPGA